MFGETLIKDPDTRKVIGAVSIIVLVLTGISMWHQIRLSRMKIDEHLKNYPLDQE